MKRNDKSIKNIPCPFLSCRDNIEPMRNNRVIGSNIRGLPYSRVKPPPKGTYTSEVTLWYPF